MTLTLNRHGLLHGDTLSESAREAYADSLNEQVNSLTEVIDQHQGKVNALRTDPNLTVIGRQRRIEELSKASAEEIVRRSQTHAARIEKDIARAQADLPQGLSRNPELSALEVARLQHLWQRFNQMSQVEVNGMIQTAAERGQREVLLAAAEAPADVTIDREVLERAIERFNEQERPEPFAFLRQAREAGRSIASNVRDALRVVGYTPDEADVT